MKKSISLLIGILGLALFAQAQGGGNAMNAPAYSIQVFKWKKKVTAGTAILFETAEAISTEGAAPGKRIRFRTQAAVNVDGKTVIPSGTAAFGEIVEVKASTYNMPAYLTLKVTDILAVHGEQVGVSGKATFYAKYTDEGLELPPGIPLTAYVTNDVKVCLP